MARKRKTKNDVPSKYKDRIENRVTPETKELLKDHGYMVQYRTNYKYRNLRYRSKHEVKRLGLAPTPVNLDYSAVQYLGIVRHHIQRNFDLTLAELELLLFLYPYGYFSKADYDIFPHRYNTRTIDPLIKKGRICLVRKKYAPTSRKQIFCLSRSSKKIIKTFYECLYGDFTVTENPQLSVLFKSKASPRDQMKAKAIAKLNDIIRGDGKTTRAHKKLNERIVKRGRTDMKKKYEPYQAKIDAILEKQRLRNKISEMGHNPDEEE